MKFFFKVLLFVLMMNSFEAMPPCQKIDFDKINTAGNLLMRNDGCFGPSMVGNITRYNDANLSAITIRWKVLQKELIGSEKITSGLLCYYNRCSTYDELRQLCQKKYEKCTGCTNIKRKLKLCRLKFAVDMIDKKAARFFLIKDPDGSVTFDPTII